jgi:hypothetical protein
MTRTVPDFIVVGVQKAGTTKLHSILATTEGVCLPQLRKEINFFNRNYSRGLQWYQSLFPTVAQANEIYGEVSPEYINSRETLERIRHSLPNVKIVVALRNPIDRDFSHYKHLVRTRGISSSFEQAVERYPEILLWGKYRDNLKSLYEVFPEQSIHTIIFEEFVGNTAFELESLARFLSIDSASFSDSGARNNYEFYVPRFHGVYVVLRKLGAALRRVGLGKIIEYLKPKVIRFFGRKSLPPPSMSQEVRDALLEYFQLDIEYVARLNKKVENSWS